MGTLETSVSRLDSMVRGYSRFSFDELVQKHQSGEIALIEFVWSQPSLRESCINWCRARGEDPLVMDERKTMRFLKAFGERLYRDPVMFVDEESYNSGYSSQL